MKCARMGMAPMTDGNLAALLLTVWCVLQAMGTRTLRSWAPLAWRPVARASSYRSKATLAIPAPTSICSLSG
jgi:hypothetical protein